MTLNPTWLFVIGIILIVITIGLAVLFIWAIWPKYVKPKNYHVFIMFLIGWAMLGACSIPLAFGIASIAESKSKNSENKISQSQPEFN